MFYSVVYASALSLIITLVIGLASSLRLCDKKGIFPVWFSALVIFLIAHLAGWVWYVISITASAYRDLIKELSLDKGLRIFPWELSESFFRMFGPKERDILLY